MRVEEARYLTVLMHLRDTQNCSHIDRPWAAHLDENVASADKFPVHEHLGNCWPLAVLLDAIAQLQIVEDVEVTEGHTVMVEHRKQDR